MKGVNAVVVLLPSNLREMHDLSIRLVVAIVIDEGEDVVTGRNDDAIAENADPVGGVDIMPLVKDLAAVSDVVAIRILKDHDAVSLGAFAIVAPVVDYLADPDAPAMVDINGARRKDHRLAGEERCFEPFVDLEILDGLGRVVLSRDALATGEKEEWEGAELHDDRGKLTRMGQNQISLPSV